VNPRSALSLFSRMKVHSFLEIEARRSRLRCQSFGHESRQLDAYLTGNGPRLFDSDSLALEVTSSLSPWSEGLGILLRMNFFRPYLFILTLKFFWQSPCSKQKKRIDSCLDN